MQKNWIGKSEGMEFTYKVKGTDETIGVYTTRPDTIMGASFLAVSTNHHTVIEVSKKNDEIKRFIEKQNKIKVAEADLAKQEKLGINTGLFAIHPFTGEELPIWIGNFVLSEYGSGALMAVPAHDQRDYEFAKKYNLEIKQVIEGSNQDNIDSAAILEKNRLINSNEFNGLYFDEAFEAIEKKQKN